MEANAGGTEMKPGQELDELVASAIGHTNATAVAKHAMIGAAIGTLPITCGLYCDNWRWWCAVLCLNVIVYLRPEKTARFYGLPRKESPMHLDVAKHPDEDCKGSR